MKEKIALLSVLTNFLLAVGKIFIGLLTSSIAVLADGIHSGMDIFSSLVSFIGIKIAKKPVDKKHPYGHYKFEVLSGLIITLILFFTGIWIIYESYQSFLQPSGIEMGYIAIVVMVFSAITNEIMARIKINYGKKENSISLLSDGMHSRIDVYTSIAVVIGLVLAEYFTYVDAILALFIGLYIIKESFSLGKEATDNLLDVSAGEDIEKKIKKAVEEEGIEISDLKTQKKGSAITANLKIKLPKNLIVEEAAKISNKLKKKLMDNIEMLKYVAIQIESHDVSSMYFRSGVFGRGFGWQGKIKEAKGFGPGGYCICPKCGYKVEHKKGVPCATLKCIKCGTKMTRGQYAKTKKA